MKNLKKNLGICLLAFCLVLSIANVTGQGAMTASNETVAALGNEPVKESIFDTWVEEGQLELTIETDFTHLVNTKNEDKYQEAKITVNNAGEITSSDIKIKARGRYRRKICDFPPLKINFDKDELKENGLNAKFDKFKLVTHCNGSEEDEQNVLKEYLAYKLYNQLTPKSYEVKLVKVTYIDNSVTDTSFASYAFMIESTKELAARLGGKEIESYNISLDTLSTLDRQVFAMFQYMIGNTDWKTNVMHNIKIIQPEDGGDLMMIPYDFDFSGLVNAAYARPNPDFRQANVRDRIFMDKVDRLEELKKVTRYFKANKKILYQIVDDFSGLTKKNRKDVLHFLKSFYSTLEDSVLANNAFVKETL